jgi:hypothetical protein
MPGAAATQSSPCDVQDQRLRHVHPTKPPSRSPPAPPRTVCHNHRGHLLCHKMPHHAPALAEVARVCPAQAACSTFRPHGKPGMQAWGAVYMATPKTPLQASHGSGTTAYAAVHAHACWVIAALGMQHTTPACTRTTRWGMGSQWCNSSEPLGIAQQRPPTAQQCLWRRRVS